jgi:hypothetical protein
VFQRSFRGKKGKHRGTEGTEKRGRELNSYNLPLRLCAFAPLRLFLLNSQDLYARAGASGLVVHPKGPRGRPSEGVAAGPPGAERLPHQEGRLGSE